MKRKLIIFLLLPLIFNLTISAKEYTIEFTKDKFYLSEYGKYSYNNEEITEYLLLLYGSKNLELPDYCYIFVEYSNFNITDGTTIPWYFHLPYYIMDTIAPNYQVEEFAYKINSSEVFENVVLLVATPIPTSWDLQPQINYFLHATEDDAFPISEFVKYDLHLKKNRKVFFVSPFMYDPYTKKLELITSLTIDVKKLKWIDTPVSDVSAKNVDFYVSENGINIAVESDERQNVRIYDVSGRLVYSADFVRNITIDRSGFDKGVYIVHLTEPNGNSQNVKIVI